MALFLGLNPPLGQYRTALRFARLARLDSVLIEDHLQEFVPEAHWNTATTWLARHGRSPHELFDVQTLLGHLGARAGRVRLGVAVADPFRRHPVVLAQAALTLSHLSARAPILGLGSGERMNLEPYGLRVDRPVDRLEEALQIIRLCLASTGPVEFSGRHYRLAGARLDLRPAPGRAPRVWLAAHGPRMLELTGRYADGWYPVLVHTPEQYATGLEAVQDAARRAGRDPSAITPSLHRYLVIAPSEAEARSMLASPVVRIGGVLAGAQLWRTYGAEHPFGETFRGFADYVPSEHTPAELDAALRAVPEELITEGQLLWGDPGQVAAHVRRYAEAGARHVALFPLSALLTRRSAARTLRGIAEVADLLGRPRRR